MQVNGILEELLSFTEGMFNTVELIAGPSLPQSVVFAVAIVGTLTTALFVGKLLFNLLRKLRIVGRRINKASEIWKRDVDRTILEIRMKWTDCDLRRGFKKRKLQRLRYRRLKQDAA